MSTNELAPEPALTMKTIRDALANRTARTKALELAAADERDHGSSPERVIARAERYFGFLAASTVEAAAPLQATSTQPAPAEPASTATRTSNGLPHAGFGQRGFPARAH